ncbi:hypothetical protein NL108_004439 [Boleophthalmus pectinirostris]|nr:hypothetical protein NL108_004439 [Boleophthalmus pectinirostris]
MSDKPTTAPGNKKPGTSNQQALNSKGPDETTPTNMEPPPSAGAKSPLKKKLCKKSIAEPTHLFEAATADASCEISDLFTKFAVVLCEKAAADISMMQELEDIVTEARNLEAQLMEKKRLLRQTLALISDKLICN